MDDIASVFIDLVIENKKLKFSIDEIKVDSKLFSQNILKIEKDIITVSNYEAISNQFVERYKEKLNFKVSNSFQENVDFINKIKDDFNTNGCVHDYYYLETEIWKLIIKQANSEFKCDFSDYLQSIDLENKSKDVFKFIEQYSNLLTDLDLSTDKIFENILLIKAITKSDADYNVDLGNFLNGIRKKSNSNYNSGLELFNKSLILNFEDENIISAILSGLYDNKRKEFYDLVLKDLIRDQTKLNAIFFGLSNISEISDEECKLFISLIDSFSKDESIIISILSLIFSILRSDNKNYNDYCFEKLELLIENEKCSVYILNNLFYLDNYNDEKIKILIKLICQNYFSIEKYLSAISNLFWNVKEFEYFKKVVLSILKNKPFEKFIKKFESYLHLADKTELDKFTIRLLTNNQASQRYIGRDIINELSITNPYKFSLNIFDLPYITQYKLWVSLTEDFHDPKTTITTLIPLIFSKSEFIKESFLCKLEELSEDYSTEILDVLENNLDKENLDNISILDRIKKYTYDYYENNVSLKNGILEFNPNQTHYKKIRYFNDLFHKNMSKSVNRGASENTFLSILGAKTTQLSKGGGWRFGATKEISQLGSFSSSFTLPRSYFIDPNKYELEVGFLTRKDWTSKEFLELKTFLDNE